MHSEVIRKDLLDDPRQVRSTDRAERSKGSYTFHYARDTHG